MEKEHFKHTTFAGRFTHQLEELLSNFQVISLGGEKKSNMSSRGDASKYTLRNRWGVN